ncbi:PREDICTED: RING-H2 finger protein ATL3-like [Nicotiana attenuata]|uniref:RING-type E3 ubiquitin transferase n=1 Tax=Nicotiana attenuata TaxID=49451 RepID=A0A1J6ISR0_NICAT|nr:PREDICTED: RING-H2 finger protein ATL3-like [Nicotiana attenuata]XP_019251541.1 PREDICTED: RING-H2 finger protein ATL3-like [Nicotiana attenuata]OIT00759.1 ring-h2 finger protein atl60 [Nicotiana attenuata]OIT29302.1 ring-h2 finger protein atl60 [Nicotiana attenuata]
MEDASSGKLDQSGALAFIGKIVVGVIVFLFLVVIFIFFLHLYVKWSRNRRRQEANGSTERRHKVKVQGLDQSIFITIPVLAFDAKEFKLHGTLECTICLCEVTEGEKTRFLPNCNHGFHVDCIDMWFQCHSTCPLCRNEVSTTSEVEASTELPNFPTNVLYWGNETQVSTLCSNPCLGSTASTSNNRPHGMLVIDIPGRISEEESKSVMPERLRRLMRLLSGDRRVFSPSSSQNVDIEQGGGRSPS